MSPPLPIYTCFFSSVLLIAFLRFEICLDGLAFIIIRHENWRGLKLPPHKWGVQRHTGRQIHISWCVYDTWSPALMVIRSIAPLGPNPEEGRHSQTVCKARSDVIASECEPNKRSTCLIAWLLPTMHWLIMISWAVHEERATTA